MAPTMPSASTGIQSMNAITLPDFADGPLAQIAMSVIGEIINYGLAGVRQDVERWLNWMLAGGSRPSANKRAINAGGVNAIRTAQDTLCALLEPYYAAFDFNNPQHFALLERTTRPLPLNAR